MSFLSIRCPLSGTKTALRLTCLPASFRAARVQGSTILSCTKSSLPSLHGRAMKECTENLFSFMPGATASRGKKMEELENALLDELEKIKKAPPSEREVQKAKNQIEASFIMEQDSMYMQARTIGTFEMIGGWRLIDKYLDGRKESDPGRRKACGRRSTSWQTGRRRGYSSLQGRQRSNGSKLERIEDSASACFFYFLCWSVRPRHLPAGRPTGKSFRTGWSFFMRNEARCLSSGWSWRSRLGASSNP